MSDPNQSADQPVPPYVDGSSDSGVAAPQQPKRPSAPFAIGLTLIIGGILLLLYQLISITVALFITRALPAGNAEISNLARQPAQMALSAGQAVLCLVAIVAGIGLVRYRTWGRVISLVWAVVALVDIVATLVVTFVIVLPASQQIMREMGVAGSTQVLRVTSITTIITSIISAVVLAVTPILALIFMTRPKVKQSCR